MQLITLAGRYLKRFSKTNLPVAPDAPKVHHFDPRNGRVDYAKELGIPGFNEMLDVPPETFEIFSSSKNTHDFSRYATNLKSLYELAEKFMQSEANDCYYATFNQWGLGENSHIWGTDFRRAPTEVSFADSPILIIPSFAPGRTKEDMKDFIFGMLQCIRGPFEYGFFGLLLAAIPRSVIGQYVNSSKDGDFRFLTNFTLPPEYFIDLFGKPTPRDREVLDHLIRSYWANLLKKGFSAKYERWEGSCDDPWRDTIPRIMLSPNGMRMSLTTWGFSEFAETWHRLHAVCVAIDRHKNTNNLLAYRMPTETLIGNSRKN